MTLYKYLKEIGFIQGDNSPASFYMHNHPQSLDSTTYTEGSEDRKKSDTLTSGYNHLKNSNNEVKHSEEKMDELHHPLGCTLKAYVDDLIIDGNSCTVKKVIELLQQRFKIKRVNYLTEDTPIDFLGMTIYLHQGRMYICMANYIIQACNQLGLKDTREYGSPLDRLILDDEKVPPDEARWYRQALGCIGWITSTGRPDIRLAFLRLGHHAANPTKDAVKMAKRVMGYLKGSRW